MLELAVGIGAQQREIGLERSRIRSPPCAPRSGDRYNSACSPRTTFRSGGRGTRRNAAPPPGSDRPDAVLSPADAASGLAFRAGNPADRDRGRERQEGRSGKTIGATAQRRNRIAGPDLGQHLDGGGAHIGMRLALDQGAQQFGSPARPACCGRARSPAAARRNRRPSAAPSGTARSPRAAPAMPRSPPLRCPASSDRRHGSSACTLASSPVRISAVMMASRTRGNGLAGERRRERRNRLGGPGQRPRGPPPRLGVGAAQRGDLRRPIAVRLMCSAPGLSGRA